MARGVNFGKASERLAQAMDDAFHYVTSQPIVIEVTPSLLDAVKKAKTELPYGKLYTTNKETK
mgnify:CR=1 FL=1